MKPLVAPSLLSANFLHLQADISLINESQADWFHIDVMDGIFVPNITFGMPVIRQIKTAARKPLDVHLMIDRPERYLNDFQKSGADILTIHYEGGLHLHRSVFQIKSLGMKAGIALNPHTPVQVLSEIITDVDLVLIMSVNPGYGGQSFIHRALQKIQQTRQLITETGSSALIEVDGGVDLQNASDIIQAGANVLVAGNTVFSSDNPLQTIAALKVC